MRSTLVNYVVTFQTPLGVIPDLADGKRDGLLAIARFLEAQAGGMAPGQPGESETTVAKGPTNAQLSEATGTLTLASVADGNTAVINGVTFTAVASAPAANEFLDSGTNAADATDLVRSINATVTPAAMLVKACNLAGTIALASVLAGDYVEIDGIRFTAFPGTSPDRYDTFDMSGTNTADCTALVAKINAHPVLSRRVLAVDGGSGTLTLRQKNDGAAIPVVASSSTFTVVALAAVAVVLVTCKQPGLVGNALTLTATGGVTAGASKLAGGIGGNAATVYSYP